MLYPERFFAHATSASPLLDADAVGPLEGFPAQPPATVHPPFVLCLAVLCRDLGTQLAPRATGACLGLGVVSVLVVCLPTLILTSFSPQQHHTAALQRLYPPPSSAVAGAGGLSSSSSSYSTITTAASRLSPEDVDSCLQGSGTRLLQHFVEAQGNALAQLMKTQGLDTGAVASAADGRGEVTQATWAKPLVLRLEALVKELAAALNVQVAGVGLAAGRRGERADLSFARLGSGGAGGRGGGGGGGGRSMGAGRGGVSLDIERLFSVRVQVFAPVELAVEPILLAVLRVACKALVERARQATLSLRGYCQLQVDVQVLRQAVGAYVKDPAVLEALLEEVCSLIALHVWVGGLNGWVDGWSDKNITTTSTT